jgi:uncharacterized protein with NRDE domain
MCTLTYVPQRLGSIITANRDETPARNSAGLTEHGNQAGQDFLIAKEPLRGGTNLAIGKEMVTVLLNGAFEYHESKISYRKSRGIVVLDSLNLSSLSEFSQNDFEGVEPFTLLRFGRVIEELRWDERSLHLRQREKSKPFLVASAKLYSRAVREKRQQWFDQVLQNHPVDALKLLNFHLEGGDGDLENDMVMNRDGLVRTVSVTQVVQSKDQFISHLDLIKNQRQEFRRDLQ